MMSECFLCRGSTSLVRPLRNLSPEALPLTDQVWASVEVTLGEQDASRTRVVRLPLLGCLRGAVLEYLSSSHFVYESTWQPEQGSNGDSCLENWCLAHTARNPGHPVAVCLLEGYVNNLLEWLGAVGVVPRMLCHGGEMRTRTRRGASTSGVCIVDKQLGCTD
jgi:hypothetical protein